VVTHCHIETDGPEVKGFSQGMASAMAQIQVSMSGNHCC
jgi:hypothetical protein